MALILFFWKLRSLARGCNYNKNSVNVLDDWTGRLNYSKLTLGRTPQVLHKLITETLGHFFTGAIERGELILGEQAKVSLLIDALRLDLHVQILCRMSSFL